MISTRQPKLIGLKVADLPFVIAMTTSISSDEGNRSRIIDVPVRRSSMEFSPFRLSKPIIQNRFSVSSELFLLLKLNNINHTDFIIRSIWTPCACWVKCNHSCFVWNNQKLEIRFVLSWFCVDHTIQLKWVDWSWLRLKGFAFLIFRSYFRKKENRFRLKSRVYFPVFRTQRNFITEHSTPNIHSI